MPNDTKYVDNVNGNNANTGNSEAQAYADIATALTACSGGGNTIYVQAGSNYTLTATLTVSLKGDTTNGRNVIEGYTTTPGSRDGRPTITCSTNSVHLFTLASAPDLITFRHLNLTHTAGTRGDGIRGNVTPTESPVVSDCIIDGCATGIQDGFGMNGLLVVGGEIRNCINDGFVCANGGDFIFDGVQLISNGRDGIRIEFASSMNAVVRRCEFRSNTGRGYHHQTTGTPEGMEIVNNTFRGNGAAGLEYMSTTRPTRTLIHQYNVYTTNGGYGVAFAGTAVNLSSTLLANRFNAFGSGGQANTSGARLIMPAGFSDETTMATDPYTSATDSSPNATAGGGAVLRGTAARGWLDIGALQHEDTGGGGGTPAFAHWG